MVNKSESCRDDRGSHADTSGRPLSAGKIMRLYSLLKNSMRGTVRVVRRFSAAYKPFILVIPNPASAGEGLLFEFFSKLFSRCGTSLS